MFQMFQKIQIVLDFINSIATLIPFIGIGKIKIEFTDVDVQFFKPIAGKPHWDEEYYAIEPLKYRIHCIMHVYNGKKDTAGINICELKLRECPSG